MTRTGIHARPSCIACAQLGAASSGSSNTGKLVGAAVAVGLLGAWAIWFMSTHPLKPEYARAGARF